MQNIEVDAVSWLHVAVGVIYGADGRILLAQRPSDKHQGGKWEFPGGKVEPQETVQQALVRELEEELGIQAAAKMKHLIDVKHHYHDKAVWLDVWQVLTFEGEPHGAEGQPVGWFTLDELFELTFPEANQAILEQLQANSA